MVIFLNVLKIIGIVLAAIVALVLLLLAVVLFVPIRYKGDACFEWDNKEFTAHAKASYLLHLFTIKYSFEEKKLKREIKILGIKFKKFNPSEDTKDNNSESDSSDNKENKDKNVKKKRTVAKNNIETANKSSKDSDKTASDIKVIESSKSSLQEDGKKVLKESVKKTSEKSQTVVPDIKENVEESSANPVNEENKEGFFDKIKRVFDKVYKFVSEIPGKISKIIENTDEFLEKVKRKIDRIKEYYDFIDDRKNKRAFSAAWIEIKKVLYSIRPRKLKGNFTYGAEDPASVGSVLAVLALFSPIFKSSIKIEPVYDRTIVDGNLFLKGRVTIFVLAVSCLKLLRNKDIKHLIKTYKELKNEDADFEDKEEVNKVA